MTTMVKVIDRVVQRSDENCFGMIRRCDVCCASDGAEARFEGSLRLQARECKAELVADQPAMEKRKPRADAIRNRERVLEAAKAVFSQGGAEASLEAVARHAGVGIGTLYRHFPTREALYEAVYRREVEQLVELAKHLVETEITPVEALRRWLRAGVEFMATKKGMAAALATAAHGSSELVATDLTGRPGQWGDCCGVPRQRARSVPKSTPRRCSVSSSACATPTTGQAGKPRCCA